MCESQGRTFVSRCELEHELSRHVLVANSCIIMQVLRVTVIKIGSPYLSESTITTEVRNVSLTDSHCSISGDI